jgi:hypothetical protein
MMIEECLEGYKRDDIIVFTHDRETQYRVMEPLATTYHPPIKPQPSQLLAALLQRADIG